MLEIIKAPFTDEQVVGLNQYQKGLAVHPFTCGSPENTRICERRKGESEGVLTATNDGWICPCGKYKQDWAYKFMGEGIDGDSIENG